MNVTKNIKYSYTKRIAQMDPKKMAVLLSRNFTLSTKILVPPGGKFKIGNFILSFQLPWASNQNLLLAFKFSVKFCTFWDQDQVPLCPQHKFWIWRHQMKLAVFLDAVWAPLGQHDVLIACTIVIHFWAFMCIRRRCIKRSQIIVFVPTILWNKVSVVSK